VKVTILTPTITVVNEASPEEVSKLKELCKFKNTSIGYLIRQHQNKAWLKKNKPDVWNAINRDLASKYEGTTLTEYNGKLLLKTGFLPYLEGIKVEVLDNKIAYPEPKEIPFKKPLPFELYPYQKESVEKLIKEKHGNVELCTGAGKSIIVLNLIKKMGLKTLVIVPSKVLFLDMVENCIEYFGAENVGFLGDGKKKLGKLITVCISKSLTMLKKGTAEWQEIESSEVMVVDETHLFGAESLEDVCHGVLKMIPYRFFMTGTLTRGDGTIRILQGIVGKTVLEMDTKEGIEKGYLGKFDMNIVKTFSPINATYKDPGKSRRVHFLNNKEIARNVAKICHSYAQRDESVLVFVDELSQIPLLTKLLTCSYGYIHGNTTSKEDQEAYGIEKCDIKKTIEDFNMGKIKVLITTSVGFTGVNFFPQNSSVFWVGSSSEIEIKQAIIGRNVRILAKSKYAKYHKPREIIHLYDFEVEQNLSALKKRTAIYKSTGQPIYKLTSDEL
jgi:superfamily II DNA or RNA helicase